jgi:hypothetical protein
MLKLWCNKRSAYVERPTTPLVEVEASLLNIYISRREQNFGHTSRRDLKPKMTVLERARSSLTNGQTDRFS